MTQSDHLDVDKLIACVYNRPALWDRHCLSHSNRFMTKQLWDEVSVELKVPLDSVKKRWNNLRDQFRKEYVKVNKPGKSETVATIKTSSWLYYEPLLFLAKQIVPKPVREYCHSPPPSEVDSPAEEVPEHKGALSPFGGSSSELMSLLTEKNSLAEQSLHEPVKQTLLYKPKKRSLDDDEERLDSEKSKSEPFKPRRDYDIAEDPDRNFLLSLLPHLAEVPLNRKLIVQRKLIDVFLEEQTTKEWGD